VLVRGRSRPSLIPIIPAGRPPAITQRSLNLHRHYPGWLARCLIGLLPVANIINLGADLGAMGAALRLLLEGPALLCVCRFGLISLLLDIYALPALCIDSQVARAVSEETPAIISSRMTTTGLRTVRQ
jgi:hypothetical protein